MSKALAHAQPIFTPAPRLLQRKCSCGNHTASGGECAECAGKKNKLQRKLRIGAVNDPLEHEADRVADQVMRRTPHSAAAHAPISIQRMGSSGGSFEGDVPDSVKRTLSGAGRALDASLSADMGARFGRDFSHVRVHQGGLAEQSARDVNARAYTVGRDVVFGAGEFAPGSQAGQRLIAHELAHVAQQGGATTADILRRREESVFQSGDDFENNVDSLEEAGNGPNENDDAMTEPRRVLQGQNSVVEADFIAKNSRNIAEDNRPKTNGKGNKNPPNSCKQTIVFEGTCQHLVDNAAARCCDADKGLKNDNKSKDVEKKICPSKRFTPRFACDNNCAKAIEKGCSDTDNWMTLPNQYLDKSKEFKTSKCNNVWTICGNGKSTTGYVRDASDKHNNFEVGKRIKDLLGVTETFQGSLFKPGAKQAAIDADPCCNPPPTTSPAPSLKPGGKK
jgi:Domain of unknown function (DUF4157)